MKQQGSKLLAGFLLLVLWLGWTGCGNGADSKVTSDQNQGPDWNYHVDSLVMPYWMTEDALGDPPGNFPAYRYPDGRPIDPAGLDYSILDPRYHQFYMANTDSLRRDFVRVKSRQVYGYCVAYHITGNEAYLKNAKLGLDWLMRNGVYQDSSVVSFFDRNREPRPARGQRNGQDLAYGLLAPTMYYYLTRDPEMLDIVLRTHRFVWREYYEKSDLSERTKLMAWVLQDFEDDKSSIKEILSPLDHLNAYLLLMARIAPDNIQDELLNRASILANSLKDNFYSDTFNIFWSRLNHKTLTDNSDFAHSIKTFWMIYTTGKLTGDPDLMNFARNGGVRLIEKAYVPEKSTWTSAFKNAQMELDSGLFAWHQAELDQMVATLSFEDPVFYVKYLQQTYPEFEKRFVDPVNKGVYWGRDPDGTVIEVGFRSGWHAANFHTLEHALIGYLSTQHFNGDNSTLYFAFKKGLEPARSKVKPYHYDAEVLSMSPSEFSDPEFSDLAKTKVEFGRIQ